MSPAIRRSDSKTLPRHSPEAADAAAQMASDLAGLERLHVMQLTLIRDLRRQFNQLEQQLADATHEAR